MNDNDDRCWLQGPENIEKLWRGDYAVLALTVLSRLAKP